MAARATSTRYGVPGWVQATPFALVFAAFFVLPLVFVVIVSFWDYNDYQMLPTFTTRSYVESFDGCLDRSARTSARCSRPTSRRRSSASSSGR